MTTYEQYPTPPPTSSPKSYTNYRSEPRPQPQQHSQPWDYAYPEPSPFTQPAPLPDSHTAAPKVSAQESYFHSYSTPSSPAIPYSSSQPQYKPSKPPRRRSSPLLSGPGGYQYAQPSPRLSPRPLYYSPSNPIPSPYSAGRPKPRPGFLRRIAMKVEAWIKRFMRWSREHPLLAGVLTFIPVMTIAGFVKIARVLGNGLGYGRKGKGKGFKGLEGMGFENFRGFNGTKYGPLEGILKMLQMFV
jgi:hypothetical protein